MDNSLGEAVYLGGKSGTLRHPRRNQMLQPTGDAMATAEAIITGELMATGEAELHSVQTTRDGRIIVLLADHLASSSLVLF